MPVSRRLLLKMSALGAAQSLTGCSQTNLKFWQAGTTPHSSPEDWKKAEQIRANIVLPKFADQDFLITDYRARPGKRRDNTRAIAKAIAACHKAGGGRVIIPPGLYHTGPVVLRSNVNLHIEKGAILRFFSSPRRYLPAVVTRWEGMDLMGYSPHHLLRRKN